MSTTIVNHLRNETMHHGRASLSKDFEPPTRLAAPALLHIQQQTNLNTPLSLLAEPILYQIHLFTSIIRNAWLFTKNDIKTFVIPNTIFGVCAALSGPPMLSKSLPIITILSRIPAVLLYNWTNLLIFTLANQRLPSSVEEDRLNNPHRAIPSGRMTSTEVRQSLHIAIPIVLAFNYWVLGVGTETAYMCTGSWVYNDLGGSDDSWIHRNFLISIAFGLYNWSSLKVAAGVVAHDVQITNTAFLWILIFSGVIVMTMQVQDLKDQKGDAVRGRKTAPLIIGDISTRWTIAIPIVPWTLVCSCYWDLGWKATGAIMALGIFVAWRCLNIKGQKADYTNWELWAVWIASLSFIPLLSSWGRAV